MGRSPDALTCVTLAGVGTARAERLRMSMEARVEERDAQRARELVAKTIYRDLTEGGFDERDVMAVAGELLSLVASGVRARRVD